MVDHKKRVKIVEMLEQGESPTNISRKLKTSRNTVYRVKKEAKEGKIKDLKANEPKTVGVEEAQVIKLVPNERLLLAKVGDRFVRVVKQPQLRPRPRSMIRVMEVKDDIYRLV